jgi:hypothetical protein
MIDHFLVKIDRENKSNHGFTRRSDRNVFSRHNVSFN